MQGPRSPETHEWPQVVDFLNVNLRQNKSWTITSEYPTALSANNIHNMSIITEDEKIVSHAVLKTFVVKTPHAILKVGAIGSVVTDPEHRQKGHSTSNINKCLELAEKQGARVVNSPRAVRDNNEKLAIAKYPRFTVPSLVTREEALLREFLAEHDDIILKPLDGMGGSSIFRLHRKDFNVSVVIETLTQHGRRTVMAQRFIPEIAEGDKRVLVIDGKPVPYSLARIPKQGETRGNLAAGGTGVAQPLSPRDREIAEALGPELKAQGLLLVGLDVIGDWLTEVNVTSPTCMREIADQTGFNVAALMIDALEKL